jgi:hypothetical protein
VFCVSLVCKPPSRAGYTYRAAHTHTQKRSVSHSFLFVSRLELWWNNNLKNRENKSKKMSSRNAGPGNNVAKVVTFDSTQQQVAVYTKKDPNEVRKGRSHEPCICSYLFFPSRSFSLFFLLPSAPAENNPPIEHPILLPHSFTIAGPDGRPGEGFGGQAHLHHRSCAAERQGWHLFTALFRIPKHRSITPRMVHV